MPPIEFSVIIPWYGGNPQRESSLKNMINCIPTQITRNKEDPIIYEVIIVEQVTQENKLIQEEKTTNLITKDLQDFTYIQVINDKPFNKSWCMNVGARNAKYNHLLFTDADSLFGNDYFLTIRQSIRNIPESNNKIMFCWNYIICLIGKDNPVSRHIRPDTTFAMGGIWYCDKRFYFDKLGGMNENYFGYGGEDNDAYERACFATQLLSVTRIAYPLAHQYHDWEKPSENCIPLFEITRK